MQFSWFQILHHSDNRKDTLFSVGLQVGFEKKSSLFILHLKAYFLYLITFYYGLNNLDRRLPTEHFCQVILKSV